MRVLGTLAFDKSLKVGQTYYQHCIAVVMFAGSQWLGSRSLTPLLWAHVGQLVAAVTRTVSN
jgi:hypothetical protein